MHAQKRVADELLRRIAVAQYAVGGRLPTENELTGDVIEQAGMLLIPIV